MTYTTLNTKNAQYESKHKLFPIGVYNKNKDPT